MCWRYAPCLFSLAWFCWEHSEFKRIAVADQASMINQADQMRGNLIINRVASFILSSLIVALPFFALLLIKYPLGSPWSH